MSISNELIKLQDLHENGTLTDDEFAGAKAKVLAAEGIVPASTQDAAALQIEVRRLQIQNEIIRLDQDWQAERETHMVRGRYGSGSIPTRGDSLPATFGSGVIGLFLLGFTASIPHPGLLPFIGVAIIVLGIAAGVSGTAKADAYEQAESRYQQRRAELTAQQERQ